MIKNTIWFVFAVLLASCVANGKLDEDTIMQQAYNIVPAGKAIYYFNIPSYGDIGDAIAIAAQGGDNAIALKDQLEELESQDGGGIVVVSENTQLAKVTIISAISQSTMLFDKTWLVYVGPKAFSNEIEIIAKDKGISFGDIPWY